MILLRWIRLLGLGASFDMFGYPFFQVLMVILLGLKPLLKALFICLNVLLGGILLVSLLSGSYLLVLMLMVLLEGLQMNLMFGTDGSLVDDKVSGVSSAGAGCFTFRDSSALGLLELGSLG